MDRIDFLGCSWMTLPLLFDIAFESRGIRNFRLAKNIPVAGEPMLRLKGNFYMYSVYEPGEQVELEMGKLFFGVVGPPGKSRVYDHFRDSLHIDRAWFINLIHPLSYAATSAELDSGILLEPGVIVSSQTSIGFGVSVKRGVSIGHHSRVDDFTEINPGAILAGNVHVGQACILGAGCVIRDGVTIGEKTLIGMGSVVTEDVPCLLYTAPSPRDS